VYFDKQVAEPYVWPFSPWWWMPMNPAASVSSRSIDGGDALSSIVIQSSMQVIVYWFQPLRLSASANGRLVQTPALDSFSCLGNSWGNAPGLLGQSIRAGDSS